MTNRFAFLISFAILIALYGCEHDPIEPDPDDDPVTCDTVDVSFTADIAPFFNPKCLSCHAGAFPSGGIDMSDHAGVMVQVNNGRLLGAVRHEQGFSPMPQGQAKLNNCEIALLESWVTQGALDN